ncbi:hypothetical protein PAL_GLEAN10024519 [Pteropus alecto]|uniref:Uncharacterized protein n=1 Tax=Pteropus alecto TaxID=9402 RepID=L5K1D4_PTEAL|nr:hypothetical protein PAL_GLEAN10024519 [Pteropus alecto]
MRIVLTSLVCNWRQGSSAAALQPVWGKASWRKVNLEPTGLSGPFAQELCNNLPSARVRV